MHRPTKDNQSDSVRPHFLKKNRATGAVTIAIVTTVAAENTRMTPMCCANGSKGSLSYALAGSSDTGGGKYALQMTLATPVAALAISRSRNPFLDISGGIEISTPPLRSFRVMRNDILRPHTNFKRIR